MPSRLQSCLLSIMHRATLLSVVVLLVGCDANSEPLAKAVPERVSIAVTSYPLLVMAEAMVGSAVDVELVVSGGFISPAWKPTADAIQAMQRATRTSPRVTSTALPARERLVPGRDCLPK